MAHYHRRRHTRRKQHRKYKNRKHAVKHNASPYARFTRTNKKWKPRGGRRFNSKNAKRLVENTMSRF